MKRITIEPVTRIEGHGKVTIQLDDSGTVADAQFQVTQVRGFEKFVEGRPYYEMPGITSRICGICPISHQLASSKACDAIMAVRVPPTAKLLRELIHCAQIFQSHALSFFYLSAPDFLLGMDSDPATRNVMGLIEANPDLARSGIELRRFGLQIIEALAEERVHAAWIVPGGVKSPLTAFARERILAGMPDAAAGLDKALDLFQSLLDNFSEEIANFDSAPSMYAGMVDRRGNLQFYDGLLRFRDADGHILLDGIESEEYATYIGEATLRNSYLKAPYYKPADYPGGLYRVGPLARLNTAEQFGTPKADAELAKFRARFGRMAHSAFLYHYARLLEMTYALERMQQLLDSPAILDTHVRAEASVNALEGVGMIEAPRGLLIHHYKVDENGAITWANLIVATGHNELAINRGVLQVARHFVHGEEIEEGMLNRVEALIRAYDPCLSCSTHATGQIALLVELRAPDGVLLHQLRRA
jgi:NAD-reducing hydrogenase large subunit